MKGRDDVWVLALVLACAGCSGASTGASEDLSGIESALDRGCADATPAVTAQHRVLGPDAVSPRSYNPRGCFKGHVVQVDDYLPKAPPPLGEGGGGGFTTLTAAVIWADTTPANQTDCEAAWLAGYLFDQQTDGSFATVDFRSAAGRWFASSCVTPYFEFSSDALAEGHSYKFAVSARTKATSAAPTRAVTVSLQ